MYEWYEIWERQSDGSYHTWTTTPTLRTMIEVPAEQLQTIFELAQTAASMARNASAGPPVPAGTPPVNEGQDFTPISPLAAEIFKTLVRCHVVNRSNRIMEESKKSFDTQIPMPSTYPGSPSSFGGGKI